MNKFDCPKCGHRTLTKTRNKNLMLSYCSNCGYSTVKNIEANQFQIVLVCIAAATIFSLVFLLSL